MVTEFQLGSVIVRDGDSNGVIYYNTTADKYFDESGREITLSEADRRVREESGFLMLDSIVVEDAISGLQKLDESKNTKDPEKARLLFLQGMEFLGKANVQLVDDWETRVFSNYSHVFFRVEDMRWEMERQLQIGRTQIPEKNPTRLGSGAIVGFSTDDPWKENLRTGSRVGESRGAGGWGTAAAVVLLIGAVILWRSLKKQDPDVVVPELFPKLVPDLEIEVDGGDVGREVEEEAEEGEEVFLWKIDVVAQSQGDDDPSVAEGPAPAGPSEEADVGDEVAEEGDAPGDEEEISPEARRLEAEGNFLEAAQLCVREGNYPAAARLFGLEVGMLLEAAEGSSDGTTPLQIAEAASAAALAHHRSGNPEMARHYLEIASRHASQDDETSAGLGLEMIEVALAAAEFHGTQGNAKPQAQALVLAARILNDFGRKVEALQRFNQAASLLLNGGHKTEAAEIAREAMNLSADWTEYRDSRDSLVQLRNTLMRAEDFASAAWCQKQIIALIKMQGLPKNLQQEASLLEIKLWVLHARSLSQRRKWEDAARIFVVQIAQLSQFSYPASAKDVAEYLGEFLGVLDHIRKTNLEAELKTELGMRLVQLARRSFDEARDALRKSTSDDDKDGEAIAWLRVGARQLDWAKHYFAFAEQARPLPPTGDDTVDTSSWRWIDGQSLADLLQQAARSLEEAGNLVDDFDPEVARAVASDERAGRSLKKTATALAVEARKIAKKVEEELIRRRLTTVLP